MKTSLLAAAIAVASTAAVAEPEKFTLDPSHSQVLFSYNHLGFSTTWGMFSGFEGEIQFDQENPENSSVSVSMPVMSMLTGWEERFQHFMSPDFFDATEAELVTFTSTGIEVTGDATARITGDLSLNGVTKEIVLDASLNQTGTHPIANKPWAGFDATVTLLRSDYGLEQFVPFISDEVSVQISIEAMKADTSGL